MVYGLNSNMLPGNVVGTDAIIITKPNYNPIPIVVKKPPSLLRQVADVAPSGAKDRKVQSAVNFPKLKGFGLD